MSPYCDAIGCDARARYIVWRAIESDEWSDTFRRTFVEGYACGRHVAPLLPNDTTTDVLVTRCGP